MYIIHFDVVQVESGKLASGMINYKGELFSLSKGSHLIRSLADIIRRMQGVGGRGRYYTVHYIPTSIRE